MGIQKMGHWGKITPDRRKKLERRAKAEGLPDVPTLITVAEGILVPFNSDSVSDWDPISLEVFLRVPERGGKDHFQIAKEGGYRPRVNGCKRTSKKPNVMDFIDDTFLKGDLSGR
jgi:hypothetical protein